VLHTVKVRRGEPYNGVRPAKRRGSGRRWPFGWPWELAAITRSWGTLL